MREGTREEALIINAIGLAYTIKPNYGKSLEYYTKAFEMLKDINEKDVGIYLDMGRFLEDIGSLYVMQHDKAKALSYYYQGLLMRKDVYGELSSEVGLAYERIGNLYFEFDDGDQAMETYKSALEIYEQNEMKNHVEIIRLLEHLAKLTILKGENEDDNKKGSEFFKKGIEYLAKCVDIQERFLVRNNEEEVEIKKITLNYIGGLYYDKMEYEQALIYMEKALDLLQKLYRHPTEEIADIFMNIGVIYYKQGKPDQALEFSKKAYDIRINLYGKNDNSVAKSLNILIRIYKELKDKENMEKYEAILEDVKQHLNFNEDEMKTGLVRLIKKKKI